MRVGGHSPCCMWSILACSPKLLGRCDCVRWPLCRNVPSMESPTPTWQTMPLTAYWTFAWIGFRAISLPGVHAIRLPSPELCYPPRMPQLCSLSPSHPTPLSSSLPARPANEVVCNASLSHRWFQPPHNFVFLCGLTLPPLTSAGPRGGDSMSGAENSDGDTGSPSQHMVLVRRCRHSATGRPRHPRGCNSRFRCP